MWNENEAVRVRIAKTVPMLDSDSRDTVYLPKRMEFDGVLTRCGSVEVVYNGRTLTAHGCHCTFVREQAEKPAGPLNAEQLKQVQRFARMPGAFVEEVASLSGDSRTLRLVATVTSAVRTYSGGYVSTRVHSEMLCSVRNNASDEAHARFDARRVAADAMLTQAEAQRQAQQQRDTSPLYYGNAPVSIFK